MKVEFEKIGQGCDICIAKKPENCRVCERNPGLVKLVDHFRRPDKKLVMPLPDDSRTVSPANRSELAAWGVHVPPAAPKVPPPAPDQQERPGKAGPPAGLDP